MRRSCFRAERRAPSVERRASTGRRLCRSLHDSELHGRKIFVREASAAPFPLQLPPAAPFSGLPSLPHTPLPTVTMLVSASGTPTPPRGAAQAPAHTLHGSSARLLAGRARPAPPSSPSSHQPRLHSCSLASSALALPHNLPSALSMLRIQPLPLSLSRASSLPRLQDREEGLPIGSGGGEGGHASVYVGNLSWDVSWQAVR